ncbi:PTS lactose/cellobiose transporter subunit IIA [Streptococcus equi]|uniref:Sugar phosphotransferase system (PTS), lactose/cellobiose-specific family, IIA component n=1 Tax=Streptococcus equi subsp. equi (strain 4047) TaxID=553482 RepID=C0MB06_STRE4|nr:PTS lactose/cellobiose transporter subunit IIA [Streptococcus equi]ASB97231.1 PTS lactose/cellobiose transporter subunit IIA [Streptococcus equi subsp. equi]KIS13611.1 cellobiose-specific PTS IIA CelA [Streptococcus equi subsp. zooepidemicus SzAM60]MBT1194800.1 PTS lactose/cellobiose transporter subunit IIA [Streptococcus equi subsp. equi]MBT1196758.1 PTS lactose/cellobiose transporter subunit IIA [Streptococcus equi subsp. equi]MBT1199503.1 PTS lactose/cellobiose transporter subunit IIA [S
MEDKQLETIMGLIMHGGSAKSLAMEAIAFAKKGELNQAQESLKQADKALVQAHHAQTDMLTQEARGNATPVSLLLVHGQDHLMTSITFVDLARELVSIYERLTSQGGNND